MFVDNAADPHRLEEISRKSGAVPDGMVRAGTKGGDVQNEEQAGPEQVLVLLPDRRQSS